MEYLLYNIIEYLPNCSNLRLVSRIWAHQLDINDMHMYNGLCKSYNLNINPDVDMGFNIILTQAISNEDHNTVRKILHTRSLSPTGVIWEDLLPLIKTDYMMDIILTYMKYDNISYKENAPFIAKCLSQGVFTIVKMHMIKLSMSHLMKIFAYVTRIPKNIIPIFKENRLPVIWMLYYHDRLNPDRIKSLPKNDPWLEFIELAIIAKNKKLVYSIAKKRKDKEKLYILSAQHNISLKNIIEPRENLTEFLLSSSQ